MIVLGIVLIVLGLLFFHPLFVIGCVIGLLGLVLLALHGAGHGLGGRHYY